MAEGDVSALEATGSTFPGPGTGATEFLALRN